MIDLPSNIDKTESLARVFCSKNTQKDIKLKILKDKDGNITCKTALFVDKRMPVELLSVNRISTLSLLDSHKLCEEHTKNYENDVTYWGYGQINTNFCIKLGCKVEKADKGGTKPYHAHIIYPTNDLNEIQAIASELALVAIFISPTIE